MNKEKGLGMQCSPSANRAWNPQAKWCISELGVRLGRSPSCYRISECCGLSEGQLQTMFADKCNRWVAVWAGFNGLEWNKKHWTLHVVKGGLVYEAINSWFCSPAGFAWLGDGRKPLRGSFWSSWEGKEPECLTTRFPAQWATWKELYSNATAIKCYSY